MSMNFSKKYILLAAMILMAFGIQAQDHQLKVMTFNVRFDNPADGINRWDYRLPVIEKYMKAKMPDIVGMQENLHHQNLDLLEVMPGYAFVGQGRDDGWEGGEFSPVFYRKEVFEHMQDGQFWLSETPCEPGSIGWDAVLPRIVTWVKLKHIASGEHLYVFNTHFSHVSDRAREKSMEFMSEKIADIAGNGISIVTGDFNIRQDTPLYNTMADHFRVNNKLENAAMVATQPAKGVLSTFNGFRRDTDPRVIDYIFVSPHFRVISYSVDEVMDGDVYISDHWPVWALMIL